MAIGPGIALKTVIGHVLANHTPLEHFPVTSLRLKYLPAKRKTVKRAFSLDRKTTYKTREGIHRREERNLIIIQHSTDVHVRGSVTNNITCITCRRESPMIGDDAGALTAGDTCLVQPDGIVPAEISSNA
jgi:hypothetical protein